MTAAADITRVGVVGCGLMGSGIAEVSPRAGVDVVVLESGFATAERIDEGMVQGCAHPMGPPALTELIGLDTVMAVAESMYEEFKEPLHAPPPMLSRMVDAGLLGRTSGRGFHQYT